MSAPFRVAIVGGGPGGLAAALTLHRLGIDVRVFERWTEIKALGGGLALRPPAAKALQYLGIDPLSIGAASQPRYERPSGRVLATFPALPQDERMRDFPLYLSTLRSSLYRRMHDLLPPECISGGRRVASVGETGDIASVHFDDGTSYDADLVIGADGIHSVVRHALEEPAPVREHDVLAWIGHTFADDIEDRAHARLVIHESGLQLSCAPILSEGRRGWHWWVLQAWDPAVPPPDGDDKVAHVRALAELAPDPVPGLVRATAAGDIQSWIIRDRPPLESWHRSRTVVLGDAAHPTSPYAGYGTGMAIVDGFVLGCLVAEARARDGLSDPGAVLEAFEAERKPAADAVVQYAYLMGRQIHHAAADEKRRRDHELDETSMLQDRITAQFGEPLVEEFLRIEDLGERLFR